MRANGPGSSTAGRLGNRRISRGLLLVIVADTAGPIDVGPDDVLKLAPAVDGRREEEEGGFEEGGFEDLDEGEEKGEYGE